jgi:hypothetical protein
MPSPERSPSAHHDAPDSTRLAARAASLQETLTHFEHAVGEIHDSDTFRRYLDAQARFHQYSFGNVCLILSQRPEATQVAGYATWKRLGRQVRRGETGIRILVPMRRRTVDESDDDDTQPARAAQPFFGVGSVFDIAQTEGEPLPEVDVPILEGDQGQELYTQLLTLANREGLTVQVAPHAPQVGARTLPPSVMGMYSPGERRIMVRESWPLQMTKTLAHELAHHFNQVECTPGQREEEETIAESSAYVVCRHFGLDSSARSVPYVAVWSREPTTLKNALGQIQAVSATIIDRLTSDPEATDEEATP